MEQVPQVYLDELRKAHGNIRDTLTVFNAVEMQQYIPLDDLLESLRSMSTAIHENKTDETAGYIFASGKINRLTDVKYQKYTSALVQDGNRLVTIGDTQASQFIEEGSFGRQLMKTLEATESSLRISEVMHGYMNNGIREPGLWDEISRGYAQNAKGAVITVSPNSQAHRVFVRSELPALIDNENVMSINGLPIELYVDYRDALRTANMPEDEIHEAIDRDLVQGSSIEFMRRYSPDFEQDLGVVLRHDFDCSQMQEFKDIFVGAVPSFGRQTRTQAYEPEFAELHH